MNDADLDAILAAEPTCAVSAPSWIRGGLRQSQPNTATSAAAAKQSGAGRFIRHKAALHIRHASRHPARPPQQQQQQQQYRLPSSLASDPRTKQRRKVLALLNLTNSSHQDGATATATQPLAEGAVGAQSPAELRPTPILRHSQCPQHSLTLEPRQCAVQQQDSCCKVRDASGQPQAAALDVTAAAAPPPPRLHHLAASVQPPPLPPPPPARPPQTQRLLADAQQEGAAAGFRERHTAAAADEAPTTTGGNDGPCLPTTKRMAALATLLSRSQPTDAACGQHVVSQPLRRRSSHPSVFRHARRSCLSGRTDPSACAYLQHHFWTSYQQVSTVDPFDLDGVQLTGHRSFAYPQMPALDDLQLNSDGQLAVALSSDGVMSVMSAAKLARVRDDTKLGTSSGAMQLVQLQQPYEHLAWQPGAHATVALTSPFCASVHVYDLCHPEVGACMQLSQQMPAAALRHQSAGLGPVAYLPGGPHLIAAARTDGMVVLWDARQQQRPAAVLWPGAPIGGITAPLAPQPDGVAITVGTKTGEVLTWDLRGGRAGAVTFGAGGPSGEALLQRVALRPLLVSLPGLAAQTGLARWPLRGLALDPGDARRAAFVLANGWTGVLDLEGHSVTHLHCGGFGEGAGPAVGRRVSWSADGRSFAVAGAGGVRVLDFAPGRRSACAVGPDQQRLHVPGQLPTATVIRTTQPVVGVAIHPATDTVFFTGRGRGIGVAAPGTRSETTAQVQARERPAREALERAAAEAMRTAEAAYQLLLQAQQEAEAIRRDADAVEERSAQRRRTIGEFWGHATDSDSEEEVEDDVDQPEHMCPQPPVYGESDSHSIAGSDSSDCESDTDMSQRHS